MPYSDAKGAVIDGQVDFSGGMSDKHVIGDNQYRYAENIVIRNGKPETRPSISRAFPPSTDGAVIGYYFNKDDAEFNDAEHTGFWFPYKFVRNVFRNVRSVTVARFPEDFKWKVVFISNDAVYVNEGGIIQSIPIVEAVTEKMDISFIQANNEIIMFRGDNYPPLTWRGGTEGFVYFDPPDDVQGIQPVPNIRIGTYYAGRLWGCTRYDSVFISDIYTFNNWDFVQGQFSVSRGDGDSIVALVPLMDDHLVVFKKHSTHTIRNVFRAGTPVDFEVVEVNRTLGCVGSKAWAVHGNTLYYLSSDGIRTIARTIRNTLENSPNAISNSIPHIMSRLSVGRLESVSAVSYKDYVMFSVPIDGSEHNNAIIVFDTASGESGSFVSLWTSAAEHVMGAIEFFRIDDRLIYLCKDGVVREVSGEGFRDSDEPSIDLAYWEENTIYRPGQVVFNWQSGFNNARMCKLHTGIVNPDTRELQYAPPEDDEYWQDVDLYQMFDIKTKFFTRYYNHAEPFSSKIYDVCELRFQRIHSNVSLWISEKAPFHEELVVANLKESPSEYSVDKTDFSMDNINQDFNHPYRKGMSFVFMPGGVFIIGGKTQSINAMDVHTIRFIPFMTSNREVSLKFESSQGRVVIDSVVIPAVMTQVGGRNYDE